MSGMALVGLDALAILFGVQPSGEGWVGWVVVVVVVAAGASMVLAGWHQKARARIATWRSRRQGRRER
jgi:hypothetical protein